jgi:hypothetical protein
VRSLQAKIIYQRVPAPLVPVRIRQGADPRAAIDVVSLSGRASPNVLVVTAIRSGRPDRAGMALSASEAGEPLPFARVAELLSDVLPADEGLNAETVRTRVGRVGRRLEDEKVREWFTHARAPDPEVLFRYPYYRRRHLDTTVGLDCGYVRNRHPRPEHHFEVVAGRARAPNGTSRCFAFVRTRAFLCSHYVQEAVAGVGGDLHHVTVLTDGDVGLRALQHEAAPHGDHVTDWFHIAMRFRVLTQTAKSVPDDARGWVIETLDRAKWHLWHGHRWRTGELLEDVHGWTHAQREETPHAIRKLRRGLVDLRRADALPLDLRGGDVYAPVNQREEPSCRRPTYFKGPSTC